MSKTSVMAVEKRVQEIFNSYVSEAIESIANADVVTLTAISEYSTHDWEEHDPKNYLINVAKGVLHKDLFKFRIWTLGAIENEKWCFEHANAAKGGEQPTKISRYSPPNEFDEDTAFEARTAAISKISKYCSSANV